MLDLADFLFTLVYQRESNDDDDTRRPELRHSAACGFSARGTSLPNW